MHKERIRIVDVNGRPAQVERYVPELNEQILASQGMKIDRQTGELLLIDPTKLTPLNQQNQDSTLIDSQFQNLPPVKTSNLTSDIKTTNQETAITYDLGDEDMASIATTDPIENEVNKNNKNKIIANNKSNKSTYKSNSKKIFIQLGSYSSHDNANAALNKNKNLSMGKIETINIGEKKFYRVLLGPFKTNKKADDILEKSVNLGYNDAFITKK